MSATEQRKQIQTIEAVYENGVFRPLTPPEEPLQEGQHAHLIVEVELPTEEGPLDILVNFYEGVPEEDIKEIEEIMLDRSGWRRRRAS